MATVTTGFPTQDFKSGYTRVITQVALANSEAYALTHTELSDTLKVRKVHVVNNSTGALNPTTIASIVLTSATVTTITAGASGAGTYNILIEL